MLRDVLKSLLPPGSLWVIREGSSLDKLFAGITEALRPVKQFVDRVAYLRDPNLTSNLADLEKEYGIIPDDGFTELVRRNRLYVVKTSRNGTGRLDFMEEKLRAAGFDVRVYSNDPAIDPSGILFHALGTICGAPEALCGAVGAVCGGQRGDLIVNGEIYTHAPGIEVMCGSASVQCGKSTALCHYEGDFLQVPITYDVPSDPRYWSLIFFIGNDVVRDVDGRILNISNAVIPLNRKDEFIRLVVKYKPQFSWAALVAQYS